MPSQRSSVHLPHLTRMGLFVDSESRYSNREPLASRCVPRAVCDGAGSAGFLPEGSGRTGPGKKSVRVGMTHTGVGDHFQGLLRRVCACLWAFLFHFFSFF